MPETAGFLAMAMAAFGVGLGKGGLPGLGNLAIAVFALVFPARESVGILLPVLIAADIAAVLLYHRHARWDILRRLFPWAAAGVVAGAFLFHRLDNRAVEIFIGATLLAMTALHFANQGIRRAIAAGDTPSPDSLVLRAGTGLIGGTATMVANAAGPVAAFYLIYRRLPKMELVGSLAWFFFLLNLYKVPFQVGLGILDWNSLAISARAAGFAVAGVLVARVVVPRLPQRIFDLLIWIFIVLAGLRLLA